MSYLPVLKNNQLIILFNDTQKTTVSGHTANDRFTAMETYDDRGTQIAKILIPQTGLELIWNGQYRSFEENFDLDTSVNVKVQDGKYIVRAKSGSNEKYGYFTL